MTMENLVYEAKPILLIGMGGGAHIMGIPSTIGLVSAFALGVLGGVILGMRIVARS
jgi:hypothetical protein